MAEATAPARDALPAGHAAAARGLSSFEVAVTIAGGTVALIVLGVQPMLYGAYALEGLVPVPRLGLLGADEVAGIAAGSALAVRLLAHWRPPLLALLGVVLLIAGNLLRSDDGATALLFAARLVAGLGSGMLVGIAAMAIATTTRIGAWAGAYVCTQALVPYLVMRGFMAFDPAPDSFTVQRVLAASAAATLLLLPFYPRRMRADDGGAPAQRGLPRGRGLVGLAAVLLCIGATGGIWAYLELWLQGRGIDHAGSTALITTSLLGQILGAVVGAAVADGKWAWARLIASLTLLLLVVLAWMAWPAQHPIAFAYGAVFALVSPAFAPLLLQLDPLGRALPFNATAQLAGLAILPTIAGELFARASLDAVVLGFFGALVLALLLVLTQVPALLAVTRRPQPVFERADHD